MRAHPRSRGENQIASPICRIALGSSPLTRGKRNHGTDCNHLRGLIPAHAGKTKPTCAPSSSTKAHPRSRGENSRQRGSARATQGSSPLTRGKHAPVWSAHAGHGLIPAHAGKTFKSSEHESLLRAHPRSRGENVYWLVRVASPSGSSPLTRGKQHPPRRFPPHYRLIPAHAGKTLSLLGGVVSRAAHPRSRGENVASGRTGGVCPGSSPLTRGKQLLAH